MINGLPGKSDDHFQNKFYSDWVWPGDKKMTGLRKRSRNEGHLKFTHEKSKISIILFNGEQGNVIQISG